MRNLFRGLRSSIGNHTRDAEGEELVSHIKISAILGTITVAISRPFNYSREIIDNIGLHIVFVGTTFALLFTLLAILFAFREQYAENGAVKELQRTNQQGSIFKNVYLSAFVVGYLFIFVSAVGVFGVYGIRLQFQIPVVRNTIDFIEIIGVFFIASSYMLTVLRLTTCFKIFYNIENIMREKAED